MPTIFDKYEIHFDGNNLWCDYPIIIGVNGTNTTKLIFDAEAGIESFMLNTRTGGALAYEPVNNVVTLNPPASYAGEDYDCLVMLGACNYHLQVSIVETPYFHDEDTEEQADDNTQEINQLKARVEENYNTLSDSVGLLTTEVESNATQIESLQAKADRALISSLQLVGTPISNVGNFFAIPFNALSVEFTIRFPTGATINGSIIGVSYYSTASAIASQLIATQNMPGRDATPQPNSLLLKLDLVNQSAILCKNVAVSNNSELQEASDVYGNTYFKNVGISGKGMIRGVAFKFTDLGTPVVSALAVTAQVRTRYSDSGGAP